MDILGNKFFSYIEKANELTQDMINQYNSSLIFLGDEKQIFVPVINTYVGLGQTAYSYILNKFKLTDINFADYDNYIHHDTVTSIYAQFSPQDLQTAIDAKTGSNKQITVRGITIGNEKKVIETIFKANKNVVVKGLNQEDELNETINSNILSGINVSISHNSALREGVYKLNGKNYSYTYYDPYDVITVDDSKTWAYIGESNTYIFDFVTKFATSQANRVYKNLLGEDDSFIEKQFDEAFHLDTTTGQLIEFEDVYVKWYDATYKPVVVENTDDGYRIKVANSGQIIYSTISTDTVVDITQILAGPNSTSTAKGSKYGGYWTGANGNVPVWYHLENTGTSTIDIVDGIQTLKEVAYVLDRITDGTDTGNDGISLAYNIAQNYRDIKELQTWRDRIGNETVSSFKSESNTDLLTVTYYSVDQWNSSDEKAVGHVKLDLDLTMAQTYVLGGITYAAYLATNQVPDDQTTYFIKHDDETNLNNYISLYNAGKAGQLHQDLINLIKEQNPQATSVSSWIITTDNTGKITANVGQPIAVNSLTYLSDETRYIYFPYTKSNYVFNKGLTDVDWVTTYVGWTAYNILFRVDQINEDLSTTIQNEIDKLDYTDTDKSNLGEFVTKVDETNGKISVTRQKLPLDTVLKNDITTTGEVYIHTTAGTAKALFAADPTCIFVKNGANYQAIGNNSIFGNYADDECETFYYKKTLAEMNPVPVDTTVNTLLTNAGNATYFYKETLGGTVHYLPLDIQAENKNGGLLDNAKVTTANSIYYLNRSTFINAKYFDINEVHRTNGSTTTIFSTYITYLAAASENSTGLADAWDVRRTIESLFKWVNIKTNTIIE